MRVWPPWCWIPTAGRWAGPSLEGTVVFRAVQSSVEPSKPQVFSKGKESCGSKGKNFPEV